MSSLLNRDSSLLLDNEYLTLDSISSIEQTECFPSLGASRGFISSDGTKNLFCENWSVPHRVNKTELYSPLSEEISRRSTRVLTRLGKRKSGRSFLDLLKLKYITLILYFSL